MQTVRLTVRVMAKGQGAFGPGKAALLEKIRSDGSISKAAQSLDMSYSRAWQLVDSMNKAFHQPLVEPRSGGKKGGGAAITKAGEEVLDLYRKLEGSLASVTGSFSAEFEKLLR